MDSTLINKFMNIVFPPLALITLFFFLRPYNYLKYLLSTARTIFREDVTEKVILITGASSGIGEHLAYEYARRGACLALVARREDRLREVATIAEIIGCPRAIFITGDVSNPEDCKRFVDITVNHFGQLDHVVTNAGVALCSLFEEFDDITNAVPVMDINFWGSVYCTYFARPHLERSKGRIIAIASSGGWLPAPRMSFYAASKAAVISLYDTLRTEFGTKIGITIVSPGLIESEMTGGKFLTSEGKLKVDEETRDVQISVLPLMSAENCAKAIVDSACRGEKYLTVPSWAEVTLLWKVFCPEILEWCNRLLLMTAPGTPQREAASKKILDLTTTMKENLFPVS